MTHCDTHMRLLFNSVGAQKSNYDPPVSALRDIVITPFPTQRAVATATIGSATARLADIGPLAIVYPQEFMLP